MKSNTIKSENYLCKYVLDLKQLFLDLFCFLSFPLYAPHLFYYSLSERTVSFSLLTSALLPV